MKTNVLFTLLLAPLFCWAQLIEDFSDGDFTHNPTWEGCVENFVVNKDLELQSAAKTVSVSYLFTPSGAIENAVWKCSFKIKHTTSASNYASMYVISDKASIEKGLKGYYVQVGGTNDEVSLFYQDGNKKQKIIDGEDKRTDGNPVEIKVKLTRDEDAVFRLYSQLPTETDWYFEGEVKHDLVQKSKYFGLVYSNTSTTGDCYYFDYIYVEGNRILDETSPEVQNINIVSSHQLQVDFSETMLPSDVYVLVDEEYINILSRAWDEDFETLLMDVDFEFTVGEKYSIRIENAFDEGGNYLLENQSFIGIPEAFEVGDIVFNEVMFHQHENSAEYVEFYNRSEKVLDMAGMYFTTRKADGSLNTGVQLPGNNLIFPYEYLALTADVESVREHHACPPEAHIIQKSWNNLNNEAAVLVLTDADKQEVYDEFSYHKNMHHAMVKNPKGVALERIFFDSPTQDRENWHSAGSLHNYGTPGFQNSQYKELDTTSEHQGFYLEKEYFSPDNDGIDDLCVLRYDLESPGYVLQIKVLNPVGQKVYSLCSQYLAGQEGVFTWDGRNDKGETAAVGIYIFCIEAYHPEAGAKKNIKLPIALSTL